jgi:chemotaxis protein histidine kinase CheA
MKGISSGTVLAGGTIGLVLDVDQFIQLGIEESTEKSVEVV